MELRTHFLADYAEVLAGKLYVQGGLVTQVWRAGYPAPLDLSLVLVFQHTRLEENTHHDLEIRVLDADGGAIADPLRGGIGVGEIPSDVPRGLPFFIPVTIRLGFEIPGAGTYSFGFLLDQHDVGSMPFLAHVGPPPSG